MARERVISAERQNRDNDAVNFALRPTRLDDITGQQQVVEQLRIAIEAARKRSEPLEHILLDGPPGLGYERRDGPPDLGYMPRDGPPDFG